MSIFETIVSKVVNVAEQLLEPAEASKTSVSVSSAPGTGSAKAPVSAPAASTAPSQPSSVTSPQLLTQNAQPVDVESVLTRLAAQKNAGGNWRTSIVDLLKLLDLDSSLSARKQLANEIGVHVGADGTAEENLALHKAVMQKLSENGGNVPESLKA